MPTTPIQALPYPSGSDAPAGPAQLKALAEAVEKGLAMRFASIAERDAKLPAGQRVAGMIAWVDADQTYYVWSTRGTPQWRVLWMDTDWTNVTLASGFSGALQVRRIGYEVHWTGQVTRTAGAFAVGTTYTVVAPGGVPAAFYSTTSFTRNAGAAINVVGLTAYFGVGTDGSVAMRVSVAGNDFQTSSVTYTVG